ncbi:MAG: alpha/beta fold hydrolase [Leptospiraceae bacterium]|nr:alpha/beta fold hydrolase [Leptospiraceae bacterium]
MEPIPFQPTLLGKSQHFQTISAHLLARVPGYLPHKVGLLNESAVLPTQEDSGDRLLVHIHRFVEERYHPKPVVVLVHGLEGSASSNYIVHTAEKLLRAGFHVVRMNLRTCGSSLPLARRAYHAGLTIDLETVLDYARSQISPHVALVGFSLGANLTLKLMGEDQEERNRQRAVLGGRNRKRRRKQSPADTFVAVSPPLELLRSCEQLDSPNCVLYRRMFLKEIKSRAMAGKFGNIPDLERELSHIKNFFDFDHHYVAPNGGFRGAVEYYLHCASRHYVSNIEVPGLVLHARDDPLINPVGWDETNWSALPHIKAEITEHGGHMGWIARRHPLFADRRWMDYRILHFLSDWRDSLR